MLTLDDFNVYTVYYYNCESYDYHMVYSNRYLRFRTVIVPIYLHWLIRTEKEPSWSIMLKLLSLNVHTDMYEQGLSWGTMVITSIIHICICPNSCPLARTTKTTSSYFQLHLLSVNILFIAKNPIGTFSYTQYIANTLSRGTYIMLKIDIFMSFNIIIAFVSSDRVYTSHIVYTWSK